MQTCGRLLLGLALSLSACDGSSYDGAPAGDDAVGNDDAGEAATGDGAADPGDDTGEGEPPDPADDGAPDVDDGDTGQGESGQDEGATPPGDDAAEESGGESDDGSADTGDAEVPVDTGGEPSDVSFTTDVLPIIQENCGCHRGSNPSAGLDLRDDVAYASLVDQPSSAGPLYVVPGSPDDSYVLHKLQGTQASVGGFGSQMPLGETLSGQDVETFTAWIEQGSS